MCLLSNSQTDEPSELYNVSAIGAVVFPSVQIVCCDWSGVDQCANLSERSVPCRCSPVSGGCRQGIQEVRRMSLKAPGRLSFLYTHHNIHSQCSVDQSVLNCQEDNLQKCAVMCNVNFRYVFVLKLK